MLHGFLQWPGTQLSLLYDRSEEKLRQMQASLGLTNCHLLRINTGKAESNSNIGYEGLWRAHIRGTLPGGGAGEPQGRPPVPPQGYGAGLSTSDMEGVAKFLEEFAVRVLLPHLEVRVRNLNHQVGLLALAHACHAMQFDVATFGELSPKSC